MQKSFVDAIAELRKFVNRKDVPANHVAFLLGKPKSSHLFGAMRVKPFDSRFSTILVNLKPQNFNIVRYITFTCINHPIGLGDLTEKFGAFIAQYNEEKNFTTLTCTSFEEDELMDSILGVIEGYHMENAEGGLLLHQPGGSKVVVPLSEILLPEFTFTLKEFERPADKSGKNPVFK